MNMNHEELFILQLAASFVAGGLFVATLTYLAEKSSERVSGIFLSFPSTALMGFFFLGWTQGSAKVASVIPDSLFGLSMTMIFPVFYVFLAKIFSRCPISRLVQIILSFLLSSLLWFAMVIPGIHMVHWYFSSAFAIYLMTTLGAHLIFQKQKSMPATQISYTKWQLTGRFLFVGFLIFLVTLFGEIESAAFGGALSMFPAAFSSGIMILHWYHGSGFLFSAVKRVPLGSISILVYACVVMISFPAVGFVAGTLLAFASSLLVSWLLSHLPQRM